MAVTQEHSVVAASALKGKGPAMNKEISIERSLLYLAAGATTVFLIFTASFLWFQRGLTTYQTQSREIVTPAREAMSSLKDSFDQLLLRQSRVLTAESVADLATIEQRQEIESRIERAEVALSATLPKLFSTNAAATAPSKDDSANLASLSHDVAQFMVKDTEFLVINRDHLRHLESFSNNYVTVEADLKAFLESVHGISGKIRFANGSMLRKLSRTTRAKGFSSDAQAIVTNQLLIKSSHQGAVVAEILGDASELTRLSGKIGLVTSSDQLTSLITNELVQIRERLLIDLSELLADGANDADIDVAAHELYKSANELSHRILDGENPASLVSLRLTVFDDLQKTARLHADLTQRNSRVSHDISQLAMLTSRANEGFVASLGQIASTAGLIFILIIFVGLIAGIIGGRIIRRNIHWLRRQNADLRRLQLELTEANVSLENKIDARTTEVLAGKRKVQRILDHIAQGILTFDRGMVIEADFSAFLSTFFDEEPGSIAGRSLVEFVFRDCELSSQQLALLHQTLASRMGGTLSEWNAIAGNLIQETSVKVRGERRMIALDWAPLIDDHGRIEQMMLSIRDMTRQRSLEANLAIQQATIVSTSKLTALGEMAGGMAHEINTPLGVIKMRANQLRRLLAQPQFDIEVGRSMADAIEMTADRIGKIVQGLRSFSRHSEDDLLASESLLTIIDDTLDLCSQRLANQGIGITVAKFSAIQINCRPAQISQVLVNLLNNAGDAIEVRPDKWIAIEVVEHDDVVDIRVSDSGDGISVEIEQKLFQPFFTTKPIGKGTGLGLSISKGIVAEHGGHLFLDRSRANTCFVVRLPRLRESAAAA